MLRSAFEKTPQRFVRGLPQPPTLPEQVWINKPKEAALTNRRKALEVVSEPVDAFSWENGFRKSPISNDLESGRDYLWVKIR